MKAIALAAVLLGLLSSNPAVRFEQGGVRIGDALIEGAVLQLKDAGGQSLLVSGSVVEPLAAALEIETAPGRTLILEPGVRVQKKGEALVLSTHGRRKILVGDLSLEAPVTLEPAAGGWKAGEAALGGAALRVRLQEQDPDANLDSLREAARKVQQAREGRSEPSRRTAAQRRVRPRNRRVFGEDPVITAEVVGSPSLRFLTQFSPAGD